MLVSSNKLFYAVEAVLFIAYNAKSGPISGKDISQMQGLPPRYLEPMLQKLVRAGILRGMRGPQGGYVLGRERARITLKDICEPLAEGGDMPNDSTPLGSVVLRPVTDHLHQRFQDTLAEVSLAELCDRAAAQRIAPANASVHDFAI